MVTMKKTLILGALFCGAGLFTASLAYNAILKDAKKQLLAEFHGEIKEMVKQEVVGARMYASKPLPEEQKDRQLHLASARTAEPPLPEAPKAVTQVELNSAVKSLVHDEMANYVAAGAATDTPVAGFNKQLAHTEDESAGSASGGGAAGNVSEPPAAGGSKGQVIERTLVEKGGMLLPKGKLQIEPSFDTAHFSSNKLVIQGFTILPILVIGEVNVEKAQRDIFIETLGFKYGLLHNLQFDVRVPYRSEFDRFTDVNNVETTKSAGGIGDPEFGLSRQIFYEKGLLPDTVLSLTAKPPVGLDPYGREIGLGTGHWAFRGSLIAAKASDPVVIFGNLSYTYNLARDIEGFANVKPGDTVGYSLGTALALSYQTAINFQFEQSITQKMKQNGVLVNGSFLNAASLRYGFSWAPTEHNSVDFSVSMGLTADAPDYVIEVRFPFTF